MNADEQKLQKQTQFVRRRRSVLDSSIKRRKLLQRPASLEITRITDKYVSVPRAFRANGYYEVCSDFNAL